MKFTVDYEHIFFDRYSLEEENKKKEARVIIKKVFKDEVKMLEMKNLQVEISPQGAEAEILFEKNREQIKREFFLKLVPVCEKIEVEKEESLIEKAQGYINSNYLYDTLCISDICDYCRVSRKVLDRAFEEAFGKTVSEYIKEKRVDCAESLIREGNNLEVVADICGFGSLKTMQRAFKSLRGKTPGEYRLSKLDSTGSK